MKINNVTIKDEELKDAVATAVMNKGINKSGMLNDYKIIDLEQMFTGSEPWGGDFDDWYEYQLDIEFPVLLSGYPSNNRKWITADKIMILEWDYFDYRPEEPEPDADFWYYIFFNEKGENKLYHYSPGYVQVDWEPLLKEIYRK